MILICLWLCVVIGCVIVKSPTTTKPAVVAEPPKSKTQVANLEMDDIDIKIHQEDSKETDKTFGNGRFARPEDVQYLKILNNDRLIRLANYSRSHKANWISHTIALLRNNS